MKRIIFSSWRAFGLLALGILGQGLSTPALAQGVPPAPPGGFPTPPPGGLPSAGGTLNPKQLLEAAIARPAFDIPDFHLRIYPQQAPLTSPSSDPRDYNGVWVPTSLGGGYRTVDGKPYPFTEVAFGLVAYRLAMDAAGAPLGDSTLFCRPGGFQANSTDAGGMRIIQTDDRLIFFGETTPRTVYLNRQHPKKLTPTYMGHSIGHWEGDTLVIDSVGFNDKASLDANSPRSTQLHVVERMHKIANGFEVLATIDDPIYYTAPFTVRKTYAWRNDLGRPREYVCEDNVRNEVINGVPVDK